MIKEIIFGKITAFLLAIAFSLISIIEIPDQSLTRHKSKTKDDIFGSREFSKNVLEDFSKTVQRISGWVNTYQLNKQ